MKTTIQMIGVLLSISSFALAGGGGVGNGGMAYVCRDGATNKITFARLLNLWEPDTREFTFDERSVEARLNWALDSLGFFFPHGKTELIEQIKLDESRTVYTHTKPLSLTNDALPTYGPNHDCRIEQVAVHGYDYERRKVVLKIDETIYNDPHFSNLDRAALKFHEALYAIARENWKLEDSRFIRSVVAYYFSDNKELDNALTYAVAHLFINKELLNLNNLNWDLVQPSRFGILPINKGWEFWTLLTSVKMNIDGIQNSILESYSNKTQKRLKKTQFFLNLTMNLNTKKNSLRNLELTQTQFTVKDYPSVVMKANWQTFDPNIYGSSLKFGDYFEISQSVSPEFVFGKKEGSPYNYPTPHYSIELTIEPNFGNVVSPLSRTYKLQPNEKLTLYPVLLVIDDLKELDFEAFNFEKIINP